MSNVFRRSNSAMELDERIDSFHDETTSSPTLDKRQILLEADEFVTKYDLNDFRDLVRKGALLYHDSQNLARVEDLTQEEIASLRDEGVKVRKGPAHLATLATTNIFCFFVALLYMVLQHSFVDENFSKSRGAAWTVTLIKCAPWIGSAVFGCPLAVPLNRYLGGRKAVCAAAVLSLGAVLGKVNCYNWQMLFAVRLIGGIASAILICTMPLYLTDSNVASERGRVIAGWYLQIIFGQLILFILVNDPNFGGGWAPLVITVVTALAIPISSRGALESPYWCASKGKMKQAFQSLCHIRQTRLIAARDLYRMHDSGIHGGSGRANLDWQSQSTPRLSALLTIPRLRRATVTTVVIMLTRVLTCIQIVRGTLDRIIPTGVLQVYLEILIPVFTLLVTFIVVVLLAVLLDRVGRRPLLIGLMLPMFLLLQIPAFGFTGDTQLVISISSNFLFIALYGATEVVHSVYAAEAFPFYYREIGVAITFSVYHGSLVLIEVATPRLWRWLYFYRLAYYLVPISFLCSLLLVYLLMRETKKVALEDIEQVFEARTRNLVSYRIKVQLPYLFKRYILLRQVKVEPFEESRYNVGTITLR